MKIYLTSRYQDHPLMRDWRAVLELMGHDVTSRWIEGKHSADEDVPDYGDQRRRFAMEDLEDIDAADAIVANSDPEIFRTSHGGRHVELGYALARGKKIFLVGERENVFHWHSDVEVLPTLLSLLDRLSN